MQSWQTAVHLIPVHLYTLCFAHLHLEDYSHGWPVKRPLQIAVLQQEDLETNQGPVNFALSNFDLQLGKGLSVDLPSGRAWQTAGFLALLSLWSRRRGWSLVFEDDWSCLIALWANPALDLGANEIVQPLFLPWSQSRVVFLQLKSLFCVDFWFFFIMSINSSS